MFGQWNVWQQFMNLCYKISRLKNHTHVKKVGHPSEFPFGIYWWTLKSLKNQNFEKMKKWKKKKKMLEISPFYTCAPKNYSHMKYNSWDTELELILPFWAIFCPFIRLPTPPNPENQHFEKMKKASGDVIILNLCNKKHDHMMYIYSYMGCNRHNFLSF